MKHLYLIRHAKSSWADPNLNDFDRPLNKRGKRDAPFMGKRLKEASVLPQIIISSPAKRARKTARAIAAEIGYSKKKIHFAEEMYTFDMSGILSTIKKLDEDIASLGLVGHNYAITECAEYLTARMFGNIPTAGIAAIEISDTRWCDVGYSCGRLLFFDYPKLHSLPDKGA